MNKKILFAIAPLIIILFLADFVIKIFTQKILQLWIIQLSLLALIYLFYIKKLTWL